jgi:glycosyltransferase involved in cell wall biosynthesis
MIKPKVSVITITYNQEEFIRQTLDSILAQKTNFDYEVIVADDASTDKTADIIREYAHVHPSIRPIIRKQNIGAVNNCKDAFTKAKGEYIALCEGDDYWINDMKLKTQVQFLDTHLDYDISFHKTRVIYENGEEETVDYPMRNTRFTIKELIVENFIQTNSVMYRNKNNYINLSITPFPFDWYLHLYHAANGKIGFINKTMSVYRKHEGGLWWNNKLNVQEIWRKHWEGLLNLQFEILDIYSSNYEVLPVIKSHIHQTLQNFYETDSGSDEKIFNKAVMKFSNLKDVFMYESAKQYSIQTKKIENLNNNMTILSGKCKGLNDRIKYYESFEVKYNQLLTQLSLIEQSRIWQLRNKIAKMFHR